MIDFRRAGNHHSTLLTIDGAAVERVGDVRFMGVYISDNLTFTINTTAVLKTTQQWLAPSRNSERQVSPLFITLPFTGAPSKLTASLPGLGVAGPTNSSSLTESLGQLAKLLVLHSPFCWRPTSGAAPAERPQSQRPVSPLPTTHFPSCCQVRGTAA